MGIRGRRSVLRRDRPLGMAAIPESPVTPAIPAVSSLAVLPLENLSGDPSQQYFADGMTEELIGRLSMIHGLRVISRTPR